MTFAKRKPLPSITSEEVQANVEPMEVSEAEFSKKVDNTLRSVRELKRKLSPPSGVKAVRLSQIPPPPITR